MASYQEDKIAKDYYFINEHGIYFIIDKCIQLHRELLPTGQFFCDEQDMCKAAAKTNGPIDQEDDNFMWYHPLSVSINKNERHGFNSHVKIENECHDFTSTLYELEACLRDLTV